MAASKPQLSNNNLLIIMVLVSLVVLGITVFAVKFLWADITLDNRVLKEKNATDQVLTADVENAPKLINDYNRLGADASTLADALPNTADFPSLMVTMENLTNNAGVQLLRSITAVQTTSNSAAVSGGAASSGSTSDATQPPKPTTYTFSINFNASYPAFLKMLSDLELSARPIRVTNLQINGSGNANVSGEIGMETYFQDKAKLPFGTKEVK